MGLWTLKGEASHQPRPPCREEPWVWRDEAHPLPVPSLEPPPQYKLRKSPLPPLAICGSGPSPSAIDLPLSHLTATSF